MKNHSTFVQNIHLIISVVIVIPAAIIYGFNITFPLELQPDTVDESNFNKGVMGLYFLFAVFWCLGTWKRRFWFSATISNSIFILGLSLGRIISIIIDGIPSYIYSLGVFGELTIGFYGLWVLNKFKNG